MIDRKAREKLVQLVRLFRDRQVTSEQLMNAIEQSPSDPTVCTVFEGIWRNYEYPYEYKLEGGFTASASERRFLNRCIVCLGMDVEIQMAPGIVGRMAALVQGKARERGTPNRSPVWPFESWANYQQSIEELGIIEARERGLEHEFEMATAELEEHRKESPEGPGPKVG